MSLCADKAQALRFAIAKSFSVRHQQPAKEGASRKFGERLSAKKAQGRFADATYRKLIDLAPALQATGHKTESDEALEALTTKFSATSAYFVAMNYTILHFNGSNERTNRRTPTWSKSSASRCSRTWRTTPATRRSCAR